MKRISTVRWGVVALCGMVMGAASAQAQASHSRKAEWDVSVTYAATHAIHDSGQGLWLQGGAADLHAQLYRGLGVVASVTGLHAGSSNPAVAPLSLVTVVFGPRYTFWHQRRVSVYGEALVGEANGFHSVFSKGSGPVGPINGTTTSANSFALQAGGGVDL
ncbi:MAG: hypothetical protein ABI142_10620, partial [Bryocella sp.]